MLSVPSSSGNASFGRMFTPCIDISWDCGVVAVEDDVVKIPSSSRDRRGKDPGFWVMSSSALSPLQKLPSPPSSCELTSWWEESRSWRVESSGGKQVRSWWSGPLMEGGEITIYVMAATKIYFHFKSIKCQKKSQKLEFFLVYNNMKQKSLAFFLNKLLT